MSKRGVRDSGVELIMTWAGANNDLGWNDLGSMDSQRAERSSKVSKSVSAGGVLGGEKRKRVADGEDAHERRVAERCKARMRLIVQRGARARGERILRGASGPFLFFGC